MEVNMNTCISCDSYFHEHQENDAFFMLTLFSSHKVPKTWPRRLSLKLKTFNPYSAKQKLQQMAL